MPSSRRQAHDDLEASGRTVNNGDMVDALWSGIEGTELQMHLSSPKVEHQRIPRDCKLI